MRASRNKAKCNVDDYEQTNRFEYDRVSLEHDLAPKPPVGLGAATALTFSEVKERGNGLITVHV